MATTTQKTHRFTLTLVGVDELTIEVGEAIYAECDDATLYSDGPTVFIDFDREAGSLGDAVGSAIRDVERAGFAVTRVDMDLRPAD